MADIHTGSSYEVSCLVLLVQCATVLELCSLYRGIHHEFSRGNPIYHFCYFWRFQLQRSNNADQSCKILLNYIPQNNIRMQYMVYNWGCLLLTVRLFLAKNDWSLITVFFHRTVANILEKCYYCISLYCTFFIQYEVNVLSWYIVLPFRWSLQLTSSPLLVIKEHVKISSFEKETFKLFSLIQSFLLYETLQNFTLQVLNGFFCGGRGGEYL